MNMMTLLRPCLFASLSMAVAQASVSTVHYTSRDDVSWAVTNPDALKYPYHQQLYDNFMDACNEASNFNCQEGEEFRLLMNNIQPSGVYNYSETGFTKIRAPAPLMKIINDFWHKNQGKETIEWKSINSYHNMWDTPPYFVSMEDHQFGGGDDLQRTVWRAARPVLEEWTGQRLSPVSMYGIRIYKNASILAPHVDRMPLVTSCIINVAQDLDEDWPLEVFDHNGVAHNVTMEPGDMVLYESHSIIHGRPFPMKGRAYVNVFLHFEPIGPLDKGIEASGPRPNGLPPYVIPGGNWEKEYFRANPGGWDVPDSVPRALNRGDVRALEYHALHNPHKLLEKDYNGWMPIHEAAYRGDMEGIQFLIEHGASLDDRIDNANGDGPDVRGLVQQSPWVKEDSPVLAYFASLDEGMEL